MMKIFVPVVIAVIAFSSGGDSAFTISTSLADRIELGDVANISCRAEGGIGTLVLMALRNSAGGTANYFSVSTTTAGESPIPGTLFDGTRMKIIQVTATDTELTVNLEVSNLGCSDEKAYFCEGSYIYEGNVKTMSSSEDLALKIPAKPPSSLILETSSSRNPSTSVSEGETITATCNANTGRNGKIRWRLYHKEQPEDVSETDSRVTTGQVALQGDDVSCSERYESRITMKVNRTDQNLVIACFVINQDFNPTMPTICGNETTDLCKQTGTILVHYPVREDTMVLNGPQATVYEGETVRFSCRADGFELPQYTWIKVGDENRTLVGEMDGNVNKLELSNVEISRDMGQYNCTAQNRVFGVIYSVSKDLYLNIEEKTTTSAPTTTTPAPTDPSGTGNTEASKTDDDDDMLPILLGVLIPVAVIIIVIIVVFILCRRRQPKKEIEEPSEKPYNNRTVLSFQNPQPDLVADEKKFHNSSLNNSFDLNNEDGLKYADLTYDNRPRSRKPMAIDDTASDYSNIAMPEV